MGQILGLSNNEAGPRMVMVSSAGNYYGVFSTTFLLYKKHWTQLNQKQKQKTKKERKKKVSCNKQLSYFIFYSSLFSPLNC